MAINARGSCRDRKPAGTAGGKIGSPSGLIFSFERCIEDGGAARRLRER